MERLLMEDMCKKTDSIWKREDDSMIFMYKYTMMCQTQQDFIMFIIVLGQHVSIIIESSSGPSKIHILT